MDTETAIERACRILGGQTELAAKTGVTPQAVNQWVRSGKAPAERVLAIESATADPKSKAPRVTRYELRPDVYGRARAA